MVYKVKRFSIKSGIDFANETYGPKAYKRDFAARRAIQNDKSLTRKQKIIATAKHNLKPETMLLYS